MGATILSSLIGLSAGCSGVSSRDAPGTLEKVAAFLRDPTESNYMRKVHFLALKRIVGRMPEKRNPSLVKMLNDMEPEFEDFPYVPEMIVDDQFR